MRAKREIDHALRQVRIGDGFWAQRLGRNRQASLPHALAKCEEDGARTNLAIAAGESDAEFAGGASNESNLFKVMEGMAYSLAQAPDTERDAILDDLIAKIANAQEPDGYLCTYFTAHPEIPRYADLHRSHELYCAGHLIEAAVAHFEATGKRTLLDVATRLADHIDATFGPGKLETVPGHQEAELALVRLFRATGEHRYLALARYFVDMRGNRERVRREYAGKPVIESERHPGRNRPPEYRQDHRPATEQREAIGHAVRAGYFYAAMADIALECDSPAHREAAEAIWNDITGRKLYITGGVGTHQYRDEGYGDPYRLPNDTYCETCGCIALLLFSHRMGLLTGEAKYADVVETILYNNFLACTDLAGVNFFYRNPLCSDGSRKRHPWNSPACCPSNVVRIVPQIARWIYTTGHDRLYVDQFVSSTAEVTLPGGTLQVVQETEYPWNGTVTITLRPQAPRQFALYLRIPGWVEGRPVPSDLYAAETAEESAPAIAVNGEAVDTAARTKGYCAIERTWRPDDRVTINLPMPVRRVYAHEKVEENRGRVALMRGPLVYCFEEVDNGDLQGLTVPGNAELRAEYEPGLLDGVTSIRDSSGDVTALPYYAWNNREPGQMAVWAASE